MSFCNNCGSKITRLSKFCLTCGSPIESNTEAVSHAPSEESIQLKQSIPSSTPDVIAQETIIFDVAINGEQKGKHSVEQIKQMVENGLFNQQSKVWRKGMANWQAASEVDELSNLFEDVPPPLVEDGPPPLDESPPPLSATISKPTRFSPMMDLFPPSGLETIKKGNKYSESAVVRFTHIISESVGIEIEHAEKIINGFWAFVADGANYKRRGNGLTLIIPHFGTFRIKHVAAKFGINPQTGEQIPVRAYKRISFKGSPSLNLETYRSIIRNSDFKIRKSGGNWASRWSGKGMKWLSQKRKIAVYVHELTGIPLAQVSLGLDTLYKLILATVSTKSVDFAGRGHFYYQKVAARRGINPQTGEKIKLKAYKYIAFKPGLYLKQNLTNLVGA